MQEVREADAAGPVADVFADIRAAQRLPMVNLIWRHLATRPAALEWAWTRARPLYADGIAERAAAQAMARLDIPAVTGLPRSLTRVAGLADSDRAAVHDLVQVYNRGNSLNLVALGALLLDAGDSLALAQVETLDLPPVALSTPPPEVANPL